MTNKVLIAGASGVIGCSAVETFAAAGYEVLALSRRAPDVTPGTAFTHLAIDLTDPEACRAASGAFAGVTHVVYAALFEKPGLMAGWLEEDQMATNLAMIENLFGPLLQSAKGLTHVSVLQGTKAYGAHVHGIEIPARENRPRDKHANFYWLQEDYIRKAQAGASWDFTIWRPQVVFGGPHGVAMNLIPILGAYAAICRELGRPFSLPGDPSTIFEAVDADLIGRALVWAATSDNARGETFNITNGDVMMWRHVWPSIARTVGLDPAPCDPIQMSAFLMEHAAVWDHTVARHNLRPTPMSALVGESHYYADMLFAGPANAPSAFLVSTIKLRQAGFADCVDTEVMFEKWLTRLAERGVIPRP